MDWAALNLKPGDYQVCGSQFQSVLPEDGVPLEPGQQNFTPPSKGGANTQRKGSEAARPAFMTASDPTGQGFTWLLAPAGLSPGAGSVVPAPVTLAKCPPTWELKIKPPIQWGSQIINKDLW